MKSGALFFLMAALPALAPGSTTKRPAFPRLPGGKANLAAPAPRTSDGKPDLSGVWRGGGGRFDYDVCENERDRGHLENGIRIAPETLAKYAGVYEFAPGREATITIRDGLLWMQEGSNPKVLYVPRTETTFLASVVNDDAIEFVQSSSGAVLGMIWPVRGSDRKATRKPAH